MNVSHSIFFTFTFLLFLPSSLQVSNHNTLVYKTCSTQTFNHPSYSQSLTSLFHQLITQSSQHKFFKTNQAIDDNTFLSGFFQCRNDINKIDCFTCLTSLLPHHISNTLCNDSTSARLQLEGCYVQYQTEQFQETTIHESKNNNIFHKVCGVLVVEYYVEFKELMDEAFMILENGIINSDGFYATSYKKVKLMAQCGGDLSTCACSECVGDAVMVAREECGSSVSAEIYLDNCFIRYTYMQKSGANINNNTKKVVAIIVGGAATLFLGLLFVSMCNSKKDDYE
ncbi:plasmodesmata-located protein 2-like isoform X2 [Vicia villosa]|uniref:plasmodesmata-located protein 2-like isoform X2 n=1 Tax=Vicia villosa TaxID=3911 RepID=UPI00273C039A|nr:plasmodesmata-located protein 2-like isoform X2 [Vicia villosa]